MVFFSCDKCAEMLKKSKVDSHAYRCGCDSVSCVDCSVSFWGGEFVVASAGYPLMIQNPMISKHLFLTELNHNPMEATNVLIKL